MFWDVLGLNVFAERGGGWSQPSSTCTSRDSIDIDIDMDLYIYIYIYI